MSDALRAGTTGQDGGDDALSGALTGTPVAADGNAGGADVEQMQAELERLRRIQEQALAEKATQERLRAENELLKSQLSTPPTGYGNGYANPQQQQAIRMQERMLQLQAQAAADPGSDAAIVLALYGQNMNLAQQVNTLQGLISVPHDKQAEVLRIQNEARQRGELISPATAERLYEAERLTAQAGQLSTKEREQRAIEEARARGVVATRTAAVPASEAGPRRITSAEFSRQWDAMSPAQRTEFNRLMNAGQIVVLVE